MWQYSSHHNDKSISKGSLYLHLCEILSFLPDTLPPFARHIIVWISRKVIFKKCVCYNLSLWTLFIWFKTFLYFRRQYGHGWGFTGVGTVCGWFKWITWRWYWRSNEVSSIKLQTLQRWILEVDTGKLLPWPRLGLGRIDWDFTLELLRRTLLRPTSANLDSWFMVEISERDPVFESWIPLLEQIIYIQGTI